ncbi:MAG: hypothetical protein ACT4OX_06410 [Actinomycetota bacterium]
MVHDEEVDPEEVGVRARVSPYHHAVDDDDALEPLAVYDEDGVVIAPMPASEEVTATDLWYWALELVEAARDTLADSTELRTRQPWMSVPVAPPIVRGGKVLAAFSRMIGVHPSQLASLPEWWRQRARDDRVQVTRRLSLEAPRSGPSGTWRMRGRMKRPFHVRSTPVELLLWPHLGAWTKLTLEPQCRVHTGRRYFSKGHRALDVLTDRLSRELVAR